VVPGFVDSHLHVRAAASVATAADCAPARSRQDVLAILTSAVAATAGRSWAACAGLEPALLKDGIPSLGELDAASGAVPVRIRHRSLHGWLLNSAAWRVLDLPPVDGWWFDHHGELGARIGRVTPPGDLRAAVANLSARLLAQGVTAIADLTPATTGEGARALRRWRAYGLVRQRLIDYSDPRGSRFKLMLDPASGLLGTREVLRRAWAAGRQVAVHCPDLESLGLLLEAVSRVPGRERGRLRVEHASQCPPEWLPLIGELGATIVTHPAFVFAHGDRYLAEDTLAPHEWLYRLRSWLEVGCALAAGSDAPAGPADPLLAWRAACDRRTSSGALLGPLEALPAETALAAMTAWAADTCDLPAGRLRPGLAGDAVLLTGCGRGAFDPQKAHVAGVIAAGEIQ
jgi:predicted amidohydrolase YtcJ